jgi:hypothetical protein
MLLITTKKKQKKPPRIPSEVLQNNPPSPTHSVGFLASRCISRVEFCAHTLLRRLLSPARSAGTAARLNRTLPPPLSRLLTGNETTCQALPENARPFFAPYVSCSDITPHHFLERNVLKKEASFFLPFS